MKKGVDVGGTFIKVLWEDGRREKIYVRDISQNREAFIKRLREVIKDLYKGSPYINALFHIPLYL